MGELGCMRCYADCGRKKIIVDPGCRLSYQRHHYRSERWIVVEGVASVIKDGVSATLKYGESVELPSMCLHRLMNETDAILIVIEVQYGSLLSEHDIERIDDDYFRCIPVGKHAEQ